MGGVDGDEQGSNTIPLWRLGQLRNLLAIRISSNTANQMLATVVAWQVYELTGSALDLGLIGLAQFLPPLCLTLTAGQVADGYDRRRVLLSCYAIEACVALALVVLAMMKQPPVWLIYILLFTNAIARTFEMPALHATLPSVVPRSELPRAVPAYSSAGKFSVLAGPAIGGVLLSIFGLVAAYICCLALIALAVMANSLLPSRTIPSGKPDMSWANAIVGVQFIWAKKPVLGATSLDLLATLFGGVTALLPIFARDILEIGPWGLGLLRSTPAIGALLAAVVIAQYPIRRHAGWFMYGGMALYGLATIGFALSSWLPLSLAFLLLVGVGDMIGGVVRQTFIQLATPDDRRGRVLAVNTLCMGSAGQLGMLESGVAAYFLGAAGSVLFGGVAVLVVVGLWWRLFPELRTTDRPEELMAR